MIPARSLALRVGALSSTRKMAARGRGRTWTEVHQTVQTNPVLSTYSVGCASSIGEEGRFFSLSFLPLGYQWFFALFIPYHRGHGDSFFT